MRTIMEMLMILWIISEHQTIEGRTRFQKLVYILKEKYDIPFEFDYRPYYYGPYSEDLAEFISTLVSFDLLSESRNYLGDGINRYDYSLTDKAREIIQDFNKEEESNEFKVMAKVIRKLKSEATPILVREAKEIMAETA